MSLLPLLPLHSSRSGSRAARGVSDIGMAPAGSVKTAAELAAAPDVMLVLIGWQPHEPHRVEPALPLNIPVQGT